MSGETVERDGEPVGPDVLDRVAEDDELLPAEKETNIHFGKHDDRALIRTDEAGLTRRLLAHPRTTLRYATVRDGTGARAVESVEALRGLSDGAAVVGAAVEADLGLIKVGLTPRESDQHALVVSKRAGTGRGGGR
jgi:hypothetical protein